MTTIGLLDRTNRAREAPEIRLCVNIMIVIISLVSLAIRGRIRLARIHPRNQMKILELSRATVYSTISLEYLSGSTCPNTVNTALY